MIRNKQSDWAVRKLLVCAAIGWGSVSLCAQARKEPVESRPNRDSIRVMQLLQTARSLPADSCRVLHFARQLEGVPYVAQTLDRGVEERLVSPMDALDCTTFVETVVALVRTEVSGCEDGWPRFRAELQHLRYRNGQLQGYVSRLHYFSEWIADNERKGVVQERTGALPQAKSGVLQLNFMSTHADRYPSLRLHPEEVRRMEEVEQAWQQRPFHYVPKVALGASPEALAVRNGDILAVTTSIPGLDVVHVGFAVWVQGRLHLLHASSSHRRVLLDPLPLVDYSKNKKAHTGIRVISVLPTARE